MSDQICNRQLSNKELADLPLGGWENIKVDSHRYSVSFMEAWEVNKCSYDKGKNLGLLCRIVNGKYIIALG